MASQSSPIPISDLPDHLQEQLAEFLEAYASGFEKGERISWDGLIAKHPELRLYVERMIVDVEALCGIKSDALFTNNRGGMSSMPRGTHLGDFEIIQELGRGGMGVVYLARQESLHRNVALKVLPFAAVLDPNQITRFHTEAQAAASLHHANIVPVYSVGCERGVHFYSMQYIDGQSLETILHSLRSGRTFGDSFNKSDDALAVDEVSKASHSRGNDSTQVTMRSRNYIRTAVEKAVQSARALHFAHVRGIVHRDIKPSNLLIDRQGNLWVTDFGLARIQDGLSVTADGNIVGTARYMSPEQAQGKSYLIDHRTDIYSLGITLYEMLTLTYAFDGPDRWQVLAAIQNSAPPSPRSINPSIPLDLETIVLKATSPAKEDRYDSAADMADDLHRFLNGQPIEARRPSVLDRIGKWAIRKKKLVAVSAVAMTVITSLAMVSTTVVIQQRNRADRFSRSAQLIVDRFGSQLADRLEGIPGTESVRLEMLRETAAYYEQFIEYAQSDASLRWEAAVANYRLANVQERMGQPSLAVEAYQSALSKFDSILNKKQVTPVEQYMLAGCLRDLASLQSRMGEQISARTNFTRALGLTEATFDVAPADEATICERAKTRSDASLFFARQGDPNQAQHLLDDAITELETRSDGSTSKLHSQLAICMNNKASLLIDIDIGQAQQLLEKAIELQQRSSKFSAAQVVAKTELAVTQSNLATAFGRRGDNLRSEKHFLSAIELLSKTRSQYPGYANVHVELAACHNNFAQFLAANDQIERSEKHFAIAEEQLSGAMAQFFEFPNVMEFLCGVQHNQGMLFEQSRQPEKARDAYERALRVANGRKVSMPTQQIIKSASIALERIKANSNSPSSQNLENSPQPTRSPALGNRDDQNHQGDEENSR